MAYCTFLGYGLNAFGFTDRDPLSASHQVHSSKVSGPTHVGVASLVHTLNPCQLRYVLYCTVVAVLKPRMIFLRCNMQKASIEWGYKRCGSPFGRLWSIFGGLLASSSLHPAHIHLGVLRGNVTNRGSIAYVQPSLLRQSHCVNLGTGKCFQEAEGEDRHQEAL